MIAGRVRSRFFAVALVAIASTSVVGAAPKPGSPSRPATKGCRWERLSDESIGLAAWVERCDYGFRKIDHFFKGASLVERFSDGGQPEPVIDVFDLLVGESEEAGIRRLFAARTDPKIASRCVLAPFRGTKGRKGARRYTFVPDASFERELDARRSPDEVGDPPCGDFGDAPDGIQYWESQPKSGARKVLFVRVGQDEPLFDEATLRLLPPR